MKKSVMMFLLLLGLVGCSNEKGVNVQETLLEKSEILFSSLMNKDWEGFAQHIHVDRGLVYSPFSNVGDTDDLLFKKVQIEKFGQDQTQYSWSWDQSGVTFDDTPNGFVDNLLKKHPMIDYEYTYASIAFNDSEIGSGGSQPNTIHEVYPDAFYVEYFHEPEENHFELWQSIRFVYEEIDGDWYLVALVRGAHNP
ncbi:hypothetical protein GCM10008967_37790 [Bacillus carboniphilus]|uniref:Uncharacterized protein n=1 Tax=Bacillus carboniphilus TaxID=86663 RepID=A0ABP3GH94_9BACI